MFSSFSPVFHLLLAINSATTFTEIALIQNDQIFFEKSWPSNRDEAEKILPAIDEALKKIRAGFEDITTISVINGPGSFSALRIGVTIANTIAFVRKIPLVAVSTFELLRHTVVPEKRSGTVTIIHGGLHFAVLFPDEEKVMLVEPEKLPAMLRQKNIQYICADLNKVNKEKLSAAFGEDKNISWFNPQELQSFATAMQEILKTNLVQPKKIITPNYLEKPHITQSKKQTYA